MGTIRVNPDHLDSYVEASQQLNQVLRERVEQLVTVHDQVVPGFAWGYVDASSALGAGGAIGRAVDGTPGQAIAGLPLGSG